MKSIYLKPMLITIMAAALLTASVFAQPGNGPKYVKNVASLMLGETRYGQAIFNTNPEDDGRYELEVEVEECTDLEGTVDVKLNGVSIGTIEIDESGDGKATIPVDSISTGDSITVEGDVTLTSGDWRLWEKTPGPK